MENNLRKIRKQKGVTQMQLSTKSGVPRSTITSIELGSTPNVYIAIRLAHMLGVSAEELFPLPP